MTTIAFLNACRQQGFSEAETMVLLNKGFGLCWELRGDEYLPVLTDPEGWPCLWPV